MACGASTVARHARYLDTASALSEPGAVDEAALDGSGAMDEGGPDEDGPDDEVLDEVGLDDADAIGRLVARLDAEPEAGPERPARTLRRLDAPADAPADAAAEPNDGDALGSVPAEALQESFRLPLAHAEVSSPFGRRRDPFHHNQRRMHRGVDLRAAMGTPVYATASGRALMAGWCSRGTGNCVVLQHPLGWRSQYFHLSAVHIRAGQWVTQGQLIGEVGSTGRSTGPHLHFQLGRDGRAVDPMPLMGSRLDQGSPPG